MSISQSQINKSKVRQEDLRDPLTPNGASLVGFKYDETAIDQSAREALLQQSVNAKSFGFYSANTADGNRDAILAALNAAKGRPVIVDSDEDYRFSRLVIPGELECVDLHFTGGGWILHDDSIGGDAINYSAPFTETKPILSLSKITTTVQGNADITVTGIQLDNVSDYQPGDFARLFSDDIDPDAREGYSALRGEVVYIVQIDTDNNILYTSQRLEDEGLYVTNPRIARYSRNTFRISGPRFKSTTQNLNACLLSVSRCVRPLISNVITDQNGVGPNHKGIFLTVCVFADVNLCKIGGRVNSTDLCYGITDYKGHGTVVRNCMGWGWRHFVTTAFNTGSVGSTNPSQYGAPRDFVVRDSFAWGCAFAPFDEHEGARRTKFINCNARMGRGTAEPTVQAYSIRGKDTIVESCYADSSFGVAVRVNSGRGTINVNNCFFECSLTDGTEGSNRYPAILSFNNCQVRIQNLPPDGFISNDMARVHTIINGGIFEIHGVRTTASSTRLFSMPETTEARAPTLEFVGDPLFVLYGGVSEDATGINTFVIQRGVADAWAKVYGRVRIKNLSGVPLTNIINRASGNNNGTVDLEVDWLAGTFTNVVPLTYGFSYLKYKVNDRVSRPMRCLNYNSADLVPVGIGTKDPDVANTQIVFNSVSDSVIKIKQLGSDGIVRSADITLS